MGSAPAASIRDGSEVGALPRCSAAGRLVEQVRDPLCELTRLAHVGPHQETGARRVAVQDGGDDLEVIARRLFLSRAIHELQVLDAVAGDLHRLQAALAREWQLADLQCDLTVLRQLQAVLRAGEWKVTVAVHDASRIIAVWPGFHDESYGLALDVGSTTIAAHLCDLASGEVVASAGRMNPQIRFGEDLMSRV